MGTITLNKAIEQINASAQCADHDKRIVDDLPVGAHVRQGDVYLERIESKPQGLAPWASRQIAEGVTLGSRHLLSGAEAFRRTDHGVAVKRNMGTAYVGPVVEAGSRFLLTHPEHCDFDLPGGCYQVWYQSDPMAMARVAD
jgi:hypothetical protein